MKTRLLLLFFFTTLSTFSQSKECDCSEALNKDLKNKYSNTQLIDVRIELYEYYKFVKNKDKKTKRTFNLSQEASAIVSGAFFQGLLSANSSSDKSLIENIEKIIEKEQRISESVFKKIIKEDFSDNQLEAYKACLDNCPKQNGVYYEITGDLEDVFALNLNFSISVINKPKVTLSKTATLINCEPIGGFILKKGLEIKNNTGVTQYLKIIDKNKPAQISVSFKELSFNAINFGDEYIYGSSKTVPIGTIVSSVLKYQTFLEVNRFKMSDNMSKAIWVPCDGRNVLKSKYGDFSGNVPDLRGLFLRNVNDYNVKFDGVDKIKDERKNPDDTNAGVFQNYAMVNIKGAWIGSNPNQTATGGITAINYRYGDRNDWNWENKSTGKKFIFDASKSEGVKVSSENRPKNMTVYYYIKIN